jgi:hypothetical protein
MKTGWLWFWFIVLGIAGMLAAIYLPVPKLPPLPW